MASAFLQLNPDDRIGAEQALKHSYFSPLPKKLYELPDGEWEEGFLCSRGGGERILLFDINFLLLLLRLFLPHRVIDLHGGRSAFVSGTESTIQMKIKARDILGRDTLVLLRGMSKERQERVCGWQGTTRGNERA